MTWTSNDNLFFSAGGGPKFHQNPMLSRAIFWEISLRQVNYFSLYWSQVHLSQGNFCYIFRPNWSLINISSNRIILEDYLCMGGIYILMHTINTAPLCWFYFFNILQLDIFITNQTLWLITNLFTNSYPCCIISCG